MLRARVISSWGSARSAPIITTRRRTSWRSMAETMFPVPTVIMSRVAPWVGPSALTTASMPAAITSSIRSALRTSPLTTARRSCLTQIADGSRASAVTLCPAARACSIRWQPVPPDAPITRMRRDRRARTRWAASSGSGGMSSGAFRSAPSAAAAGRSPLDGACVGTGPVAGGRAAGIRHTGTSASSGASSAAGGCSGAAARPGRSAGGRSSSSRVTGRGRGSSAAGEASSGAPSDASERCTTGTGSMAAAGVDGTAGAGGAAAGTAPAVRRASTSDRRPMSSSKSSATSRRGSVERRTRPRRTAPSMAETMNPASRSARPPAVGARQLVAKGVLPVVR